MTMAAGTGCFDWVAIDTKHSRSCLTFLLRFDKFSLYRIFRYALLRQNLITRKFQTISNYIHTWNTKEHADDSNKSESEDGTGSTWFCMSAEDRNDDKSENDQQDVSAEMIRLKSGCVTCRLLWNGFRKLLTVTIDRRCLASRPPLPCSPSSAYSSEYPPPRSRRRMPSSRDLWNPYFFRYVSRRGIYLITSHRSEVVHSLCKMISSCEVVRISELSGP